MEFLGNLNEATQAISRYLIEQGGGLSEELRNRLVEVSGSTNAVDQVCYTGELLYARQDEVGDIGRCLAAQLCAFGGAQNWYFFKEGRGAKMAFAMMRTNGEPAPFGVTFQAAEDDPAPLDRFRADIAPDPEPTHPDPDVVSGPGA